MLRQRLHPEAVKDIVRCTGCAKRLPAINFPGDGDKCFVCLEAEDMCPYCKETKRKLFAMCLDCSKKPQIYNRRMKSGPRGPEE